MKKIILIGCLMMLLSCSSSLYVPIASTPTASLENLKNGRETYVKKCASCHQLHLPSEFSEEEWQYNLNKMQVKAKITDEKKQLVYQYLMNAPKKMN